MNNDGDVKNVMADCGGLSNIEAKDAETGEDQGIREAGESGVEIQGKKEEEEIGLGVVEKQVLGNQKLIRRASIKKCAHSENLIKQPCGFNHQVEEIPDEEIDPLERSTEFLPDSPDCHEPMSIVR